MKIAVVALVLALFVACAAQDEVTGDRRDVGVVTVVFTAMPAQVQVGQPVRLRLRLSDNAGTAQQLVSPTAQIYDFWVRAHGREVWRWSQDQSFIQSETTTTIPGQSSQIFSEVWHPAGAGSFTVYGEVKASGFAGALKGTVIVR